MKELERKPNVIIINADDLGYGDLACYGSDKNQSPTIDFLAENGLRFTNFYAASPVCSPSRAALMTASYPKRVGFSDFNGRVVLFPGDAIGLSHEEYTLAKMFQDAKYKTMAIGKWHLGDQEEFLPTHYGFDHYFGIPYSNDMGRQVMEPERLEEMDKSRPPLPLLEDTIVIQEQPDQRNLIERYVEHANRFMRSAGGAPFFLYFAPLQVHLPLYAPMRFVRESQNGDFGACVAAIDWALASMIEELKKQGKFEDTIIIFTSDNGSKADYGASNAPLRGRKGSTWEGGQRVPCVMHWPGRIPQGALCDGVMSNMDIMPTLASILGITLPQENTIDGLDLSALVLGQEQEGREVFAFYNHDTLEALRWGDYKLHFYKDGEACAYLYNLREDMEEKDNLYTNYPEIMQKMEELRLEIVYALGCAQLGIEGKECRPHATVAEPKFLTKPFHADGAYIEALYDKPQRG